MEIVRKCKCFNSCVKFAKWIHRRTVDCRVISTDYRINGEFYTVKILSFILVRISNLDFNFIVNNITLFKNMLKTVKRTYQPRTTWVVLVIRSVGYFVNWLAFWPQTYISLMVSLKHINNSERIIIYFAARHFER